MFLFLILVSIHYQTDTIQSGEVVSPDFPLRIDFSVNIGGITSRNEMIPETLYCESI